jgi:FKBP-type peptidyl-prolyl cis-trans isomerase SlyD
MKVEQGRIVTLIYDITTTEGEIVESSDVTGPVAFMHGKGALLPGLDKRVEGLQAGDERTFEIPPEEAFGRVEDMPIKEIARAEFPKDAKLQKGTSFEANMAGGGGMLRLEVMEATDAVVHVRMIHPLAGKTIQMSVKIQSIRPATPKEKEEGRALTKR